MADTSLNSIQFIRRIIMLKEAYKWSDSALLFVVQEKLFGSSKLWVDSQDDFITGRQFKESFLWDFPCDDSVASIHMSNMHRKSYETPQEYFYKMSAMGESIYVRWISFVT